MAWAIMALNPLFERITSFLFFSTLAQAGRYGADRAGGNALGIWGLPAGWWWVWLILAFVLIVIGGSLASGRLWTRDDRTVAAGRELQLLSEPVRATRADFPERLDGWSSWSASSWRAWFGGERTFGPHYAVNPPAAGHSGNMGNGNTANNGRVNG